VITLPIIILYLLFFISLYFEVFLLITYFENSQNLKNEEENWQPSFYPSVSILVPCFNEETTLARTIESLLSLEYPKDKFKIIIINDGSTDNTQNVAMTFASHPQIEVYEKENGGKYTALNYGLTKTTSDLIGCLDADSFVNKNALKKIAKYFEDKETMAVIPSIKVHNPKNILQHMQHVEYSWGIFLKKMLSYLQALYVTPGPFSIIRREVYDTIGNYRHAHNTEDLEIALRMQSKGYKIVTAHQAYVYTVTPPTIKKLYKQRLRWTYGFIKNTIDYRFLLLKRKYGNLSILILPLGIFSIFSVLYFTTVVVWNVIEKIIEKYIEISTIGFHINWSNLKPDLFYLNTETIAIVGATLFCLSITLVLMGRKMADGQMKPLSLDLFYFLAFYAFIAPVWIAKAVYNVVFSKKTSWR